MIVKLFPQVQSQYNSTNPCPDHQECQICTQCPECTTEAGCEHCNGYWSHRASILEGSGHKYNRFYRTLDQMDDIGGEAGGA